MEGFFLKKREEKEKIFEQKKASYAKWKDELKDINKPFFAIHTDFQYQYLKNISGGALKLYLYLGFKAKYKTGESWYSIEEISSFFEKDSRTVANWFKELQDIGLIYRAQDGFKRKATTFLRPYGFSFDVIDHKELYDIKDIIKNIEMNLELDYVPEFGLMLNYNFHEYIFILIFKEEQIYRCSCFFNFAADEVKLLKNELLKKYNIIVDNFDIANSSDIVPNKKGFIYKYLIKYLEEESR